MRRFISILLGLVCVLLLAACASDTSPVTIPPTSPPTEATTAPTMPTPEHPAEEARTRPEVDREGFAITLPDEVNIVVSIGPSVTEVLVTLGVGDKIVAADRFSDGIPGLAEGIAVLDLLLMDAEFLIELNPDIIFVTGLTRAHDDDSPMRLVSDAGITVIYVPTSVSIDAIMEDIRFIAGVMDMHDAGEDILADMQSELEAIREIAAGITETRTVYFEISPAPTMWSLGRNTFINEMIELIGAVNILGDKEGWLSVADETLLEANPDVIITSVNFIDNPVEEIMSRPGWEAITAVRNDDVFQVTTNYVNRANHNIIRGLREIAAAVYPDYFDYFQ